MGVQESEDTACGCLHASDLYPPRSDAAISHDPEILVCEVMVLPHPVIARSGPPAHDLARRRWIPALPVRLGALRHKRRGNLT